MVDSVVATAAEVDGTEPIDEAARMSLAHRGVDGNALWLADGGFALLRGHDLDVAVAPGARGRGEGRALVAAALEEAPADVTAWSHADHPAAAALARRFGFARERELWVMRRPMSVALPEGVVAIVPDEVVVRGYTSADAEEVLRVNAAAFAAHPEQGSMDAVNLAERMAEPWFDPAGLLLAEDASSPGRLLGFHWTKQHSAELGEVYVVGIDPAAQGRGLGKLVTLAGLRHLADRGVDEVLLYVESDNRPAIAVYSGLGFTHHPADTHVMYERRG